MGLSVFFCVLLFNGSERLLSGVLVKKVAGSRRVIVLYKVVDYLVLLEEGKDSSFVFVYDFWFSE